MNPVTGELPGELPAERREALAHEPPERAPEPRRSISALLVAIGATYSLRLVVATLASYPFIASVSASGVAHFDAGDGKLFEPGGLYLLEVLLRQRALLAELVAPTALLLLVGSLAGVVPEWLLLRALAGETEHVAPADSSLARAPRKAWPRLVLLALASWVARALLAFATAALAMTARSYFASVRDERLPLLAASVAVLLGLVGWACLAVLRDLAAIQITLAGSAPLDAIERGLGLIRRRPLGLALRYASWTLAGLLAWLAGAALAGAFDVSTGGSAAPLAAAALHQLAVVAQITLRAAWLSSAVAASTPGGHERQALDRPQADAFL